MIQPSKDHAPTYHRPSTPVFAVLTGLAAVLAVQALSTLWSAPREAARIAASADLVARLGLSDLALFTEARYTRHPSLADLATPFQDNPASFEHFPSGSFVAPPRNGAQTRLGFDAEEMRR